jgi:very-short-patch-repair endonuclease
VITRRQLLERGVSRQTIGRRLAKGRLHPLWRGVYAVGRPRLTLRGWWMAALLACNNHAVLSHESAAELWGIRQTNSGNEGEFDRPGQIHVSVPGTKSHHLWGIRVHRRTSLPDTDRTERDGIPVTSLGRTLIDLATVLDPRRLEASVNEADKRGTDPEQLRHQIDDHRGMDGVPSLRRILDRRTFSLTDSELERRFLRLVRRAKLPAPKTQQRLCGFRVDFLWPELRLIVETDGLRYHRTAAQQATDRVRDQVLVAAGFTVLRFTHAQVAYDQNHVVKTLRTVLR